MSEFNEAQKIVAQNYSDGDYAHVATLDECRDMGDTLFTFLMIELSDKEGSDTLEEAIRRSGASIADIEKVRTALEAAR